MLHTKNNQVIWIIISPFTFFFASSDLPCRVKPRYENLLNMKEKTMLPFAVYKSHIIKIILSTYGLCF